MGPARYGFIVYSVIFLIGCFLQGFSLNVEPRDVINLIETLNTSDGSTYKFTSGPNNNTLAIELDETVRHVALPERIVDQALTFLSQHTDITFLATVRQEIGDSGSIIAFSSNIIRFLEIESSGRKDEIRFHYTHDQQIQVETFPYRLADNQWHKLAISLSANHLVLLVDCSKIYERVIKTIDRTFTSGKLSLFLGQRNSQHALFRGSLYDVKIVTQAHGYLLQCPNQNTDCPTCAQYKDMEQKIEEMYSLYKNMSNKLLKAEERISGLEQCECSKSCYDNGTIHKEGEMWEKDKCTRCSCRNGSIHCGSVDCPLVKCSKPVYRDGTCCPFCLTNCYYSGQYFDHGQDFKPRVCVNCTCDNGKMICEQQDPEESCPKLNCPESERLQIQGECCPVCKGTNFCGLGHNCHINATCVNLATRYACQCQLGFQGDGIHCEDINECLAEGGKTGHHCHSNTVCVNTIGSYACQCSDGHNRLDAYSCEGELMFGDGPSLEIDECASGSHHCHANADCINIKGSYKCECSKGYQGDGVTKCEASCHGQCLNGGKCLAPNVCECRHGYIGPNCELDIDECGLGISACHGHSVCVNIPGWYRCDCLEGYHCNWPDNHYGSLCLDINECIGEGSGHTCHTSMECINMEGGYECACKPGTACIPHCIFEEKEYGNSEKWFSTNDKCLQCSCMSGVTTCHKRSCDCMDPDVDLDCCPHCDLTAQCSHQEYPLYMQNGEQWSFQCQTCECLHGEVDCWPLECPNIICENIIQEPGDCCPRCIDDSPCTNLNLDVGGLDHSSDTCIYVGRTYRHGNSWLLDSDPCTTCDCIAGHICCSFNETCSVGVQLQKP
ncbi:protein kinase C-binding protein NELL1 isoform X1 [Patella vulgata]|uniref:protein kinase C-binding protein NELL1 isoform X1 n=1 Tax=Patella vulgata TaxID=6465 RepID=UPI00217FDBA4|nr:protein kinase C-binding protein NELL1 isoform X1 [Patella vulgata]